MKNYKSVMWVVVVLSMMHWSAEVSAQLTKVAIGYSGISADQLVIWVAKDAGIFAKNNIDAQTVYFSGGTRVLPLTRRDSIAAKRSGVLPVCTIVTSFPGVSPSRARA